MDSQIFSRISKLSEQRRIILEKETVWPVWHHINGEEIEMKMIVGPDVITVKGQQQITVNMTQIKEIDLWNGPEGYQDEDELKNTCFSILHFNGAKWETLGFEMNTPEERIALVMDIIDELQLLGAYPQRLSPQIVVDSMGLDESLEIPFDYGELHFEEHHLEIVKEEHPMRLSQIEKQSNEKPKADCEELRRLRAENKEIREQLNNVEEANMTNQGTIKKLERKIEGMKRAKNEETERKKALQREIRDIQQRIQNWSMGCNKAKHCSGCSYNA